MKTRLRGNEILSTVKRFLSNQIVAMEAWTLRGVLYSVRKDWISGAVREPEASFKIVSYEEPAGCQHSRQKGE
jgi:hypothetical protein